MASIGRVNIKGSILPKSGTIGRISVRFDGSMPHSVGSRGKVRIYRTDGNLQVIFHNPGDAENIEFEGKKVDLYYDY
jgi:hypothetical protein